MKIELRRVSFQYHQLGVPTKEERAVLADIDLVVQHHEILSIVGPSGSGKTTLIQILNGLLVPNHGQIFLDDQPIQVNGEYACNWFRRVGIVFQFPELQFFENTIYDEIAFALRNRRMPESEIKTRVENVLKTLELHDGDFCHRSPFHLSEGQKRRVAIASILVLDPEVLILDEPTSGLDYAGVNLIKRIIDRIYHDNRIVIIVSHDMDFVAELSQRVVALVEGKVLFDGVKADFFTQEKLLQQAHLQPPQVMRLARRLIQEGKKVKYPVFSLIELQDSLA